MKTLLRMAARNLRRNTRRTLITLSAVVIGVAVVVFMNAFKNGFVDMLIQDTTLGRIGALQVHAKGYFDANESLPTKLNFPDDGVLAKKILAVKGVTAVSPRIVFGGLASNGATQAMFMGTALDPSREYAVSPRLPKKLLAGSRPLEAADTRGALIGVELAKAMKVKPGGTVTLLAQGPSGSQNVLEAVIQGYPAQTTPFEGKRVLVVPLSFAQELLGMQGRITEYAVAVDDPRRVDEIAKELRAALGPDYEVHTWRQLAPFIEDIVRRQAYILGLISVVLFVIVVTGIINTMLMSTFERVREVGTMMALGLRRRAILTLFLLESAVLGLSGAAAGALLSLIAVLVMGTKGLHLKLPGGTTADVFPFVGPGLVFGTIAIAVVGAVLSALYPAFKASRLRPVEALRAP